MKIVSLLLVSLVAVSAFADWSSKMTEISKALSELLPKLVSAGEPNDPALAKSLRRIADLAAEIDQSHAGHVGAPDKDPALRVLSEQFHQDLDQAARAAEAGNADYAKALAKSSVSLCITCHTRNPSGPRFAKLPNFETQLKAMPWIERVTLKAATRQFDDALSEIDHKLEAPAGTSILLEVDQAVKIGLMIAVRATESPERAIALVESALKSSNTTAPLKQNAKTWLADLKAWRGAKPVASAGEKELLAEARRLLDGHDDGVKTGDDEIRFLRASMLMHALLRRFPDSPDRAEALYVIGSSYDVLGDLGFWNLGDKYFIACVDASPHSKIAERCARRYENSLTLGYTGSAGISLPKAVKAHLDQVRAKAEVSAKKSKAP